VVVWQYEVKLDSTWENYANSTTNSNKFVRTRNNSKPGSTDPRHGEIQGRASLVTGSGVGFLPSFRNYNPENDPIGEDEGEGDLLNYQPGGDTEALRGNRPWSASDHVANSNSPFLFLTEVWIRVTFEWDFDNDRVRIWYSDENTDTVLATADMNNSSLGYPPGSSAGGIDQWYFNVSQSGSQVGDDCFHWHRNLVVGEFSNRTDSDNYISSFITGRPGSEADTVAPTLNTVTIEENGTSITYVYSEAVTADTTAELCNDYVLTMTTAGSISQTYASGDGTATVVCTSGTTINVADTVSVGLNYTASSGSIVDEAVSPNALADISSKAVTNNSTAGGGPLDYYVDDDATPGGNGLTYGTAFDTIADLSGATILPGSTIYLDSDDDWDENLTISQSGESGKVITVTQYGTGARPVIDHLDVTGNYVTVDNVDVNPDKDGSTVTSVSGEHVTFTNMEISNGTRDGISLQDAYNFVGSNLVIHDLLRGYYAADPVQDAHGISVSDSYNVDLDNIEIYRVSGDSLQIDPLRGELTDNITIDDSTFWTGALPTDFNGTCPHDGPPITTQGWCAGDSPGENFIDTKSYTGHKMGITLNNVVMYGLTDLTDWDALANRAALNVKENTTFVANRIKIYNSEYGMRFRGRDGDDNSDITISNGVFYSNESADLRVEDEDGSTITTTDELHNLKFYNSTFASTTFYDENHQTLFSGWDLRNNAFLGTKPARFSDSTNINADSGDFVDSSNNNYSLDKLSDLIGAGDVIAVVTDDYLGKPRGGVTNDVGAYLFSNPFASGVFLNGVTIGQ
jgi:hypothetical protein